MPDVEKRRLNAGEHRVDPPQVNVADHAPVVGPIHQQLDEAVVLQDGHAGLALAAIDENLALHGVVSWPIRRRRVTRGGVVGAGRSW